MYWYMTKIKTLDLFGRKTLYASVDESELTPQVIASILKDVLPVHKKNVSQIRYLRKVAKGNQEVYSRVKEVRPEINNKVVENHIGHAISFKKGYVFGYPIQYVQMSDDKNNLPPNKADTKNQGFDSDLSKDLGIINQIMRSNNKASKDIELSNDLYITGVGVRYFVARPKDNTFDFYNLNPENSFVVYSNGFDKKRLFGVYMVKKTDYINGQEKLEFKVFTNKKIYNYTLGGQDYLSFQTGRDVDSIEAPLYVEKEPKQEINALGYIPIVEYQLNSDRISLVERMLGSQNALNELTSSEVDDVQQFVQAMMVFLNAEIDEETLTLAKELGAINIMNNGKTQGDVKLLTSKLSHNEAKVLHDRILHNMLINAGIPLINVGGGSGGDTGLARLTDNGWLMADTKAREDELAFVEGERVFLEIVIDYLSKRNVISEFDVHNIETKFTRHKSDNLLTKTQALQSMVGVLHPDDAFAIVDLFSDPSEAVAKARDFYGDKFFDKQEKESLVEEEVIQPVESNEPTEE